MDSDTTRPTDPEMPDQGADGPDPADLPLPPYPPNLGRPAFHVFKQARDMLGFTEQAHEEHDIFRTRLPGQGDMYQLAHPDYVRQVLVDERENFQKGEDFLEAYGDWLLTVEGENWMDQRETLQPHFAHESVLGYADGMGEQIERRVDRWHDGDRLDLQAEFTHMTLDVLFATLFGYELALDGDERLRTAAENLNEGFVPSSFLLPDWVPTPSRRRFGAAKSALKDEGERLLEERMTSSQSDLTEANDLLSLIVGLRMAGNVDSELLTDERLRDMMMTIVFAGHDTTTSLLTFASWTLSNNPDVRRRFHEEVDQLEGALTVADVEKLDVTDRIVTETLRLFPPVFTLPRQPTETVAVDGYRIPEGESAVLPIRLIQRDERFYEEPEEFRPSRWTPEFRKELHDYAYAPFGAGPRVCIGREFALVEAKLALAIIGRRYRLDWLGENDSDGEPPVSPELTLRMEKGQEFRVVER